MGITSIHIITPPEAADPLSHALMINPELTGLPLPRPEVLVPKELGMTTGTAELLRLPEVQKCIHGDFVVLPCDFVSEMEGTKMVQQWMTLNPLSTTAKKGGLAFFYPTQGLEGVSTKKDETDFLATISLPSPHVPPPAGSLRSGIEEVMLSMPTDTLNDKLEDEEFLLMRQSLVQKHVKVRMRTKWRDGHVYIFPKWIKDFVRVNEDFESVSEDVLGWWAKARWQGDELARKLRLPEVLGDGKHSSEDGEEDEDGTDGVDVLSMSSTTTLKPVQRPNGKTFASRVAASAPSKAALTVPLLLAYVQPKPDLLIRRVDTSAQLLTISLHLAKQAASSDHPLSHAQKVHPTAKLEQQARVSEADSLIAENVHLGFRSNVKESVIGATCEIGKNVRLTRCLLMEGVVVGDGVVMVGCIVGRRAKIEGLKAAEGVEGEIGGGGKKGKGKTKSKDDEDDERTKLTDCEIAPGFVVEAGTEAKGEKLMGFDTEEGSEMEMEVDEDDED